MLWAKDFSGRYSGELTGAFLAKLVAKEPTILRITVHMVKKNICSQTLSPFKRCLLNVNGPVAAAAFGLLIYF